MEPYPDPPAWVDEDPRSFLRVGTDGSCEDNQRTWGRDRNSTFGVAIDHGSLPHARLSGYTRLHHLLPEGEVSGGVFNGSSGAAEAKAVDVALAELDTHPNARLLPRRALFSECVFRLISLPLLGASRVSF